MKLCTRIDGVRERLWDGSLTLDAAAQLQAAFERRDRERGRGAGTGSAMGSNGSARPAPEPKPGPVLDVSAQKALVEQAAGKSTREVTKMLADVDPALAVPADRLRPLGEGRWELKAVIDADCHRGLEQLKGLLSHVDPHMTLGQLVGRLVNEGLDRHDPGRPPRRGRTRSAPAGADRPPAAKRKANSDGAAASATKRPARSGSTGASAPHTERDSNGQAPSVAKQPARPVDIPASAPKSRPRAGRAIPAAVRREVWQRDRGRCRYVDPRTGRRCASRHLLQIDHVLPCSRAPWAAVRSRRTSDCCASRITATAIRSGLHGEGRPRDRHGRAAEHRQPSIAARNPEDPAKVPKRTQAPYQDRARRGGPPSTFANTSQYDQERSYT